MKKLNKIVKRITSAKRESKTVTELRKQIGVLTTLLDWVGIEEIIATAKEIVKDGGDIAEDYNIEFRFVKKEVANGEEKTAG